MLEFDDYTSLVMSLTKLVKWIKDDNDFEKECPKAYKITPVWLTKKEVNLLQEADI